MVAISVENPAEPFTCATYGSTEDSYGTWGIDYFNQVIYAAYIWSPFGPPQSNFNGLRIINVNLLVNPVDDLNSVEISIFPNPVFDEIMINLSESHSSLNYQIINTQGQIIKQGSKKNVSDFTITTLMPPGIYFLHVQNETFRFTRKIIKK